MSNKKNPGLTRRASGLMALEQRFMFDGAAVADAFNVFSPDSQEAITIASLIDVVPQATDSKTGLTTTSSANEPMGPVGGTLLFLIDNSDATANGLNLQAGLDEAQRTLQNWANSPKAATDLTEIFLQPEDKVGTVLESVRAGTAKLRVELRDHGELLGAMGAFAATGSSGSPVIYLNRAWLDHTATTPSAIAAVALEEYGHYLDTLLNENRDTRGDEGALFSAKLRGEILDNGSQQRMLLNDDHALLTIEGAPVLVEQAVTDFIDINFGALDFSVTEGSDIRISGSSDSVGETWLYRNVGNINGQTVDAIVKFDSITAGSSMTAFDSTTSPYSSTGTWASSPNNSSQFLQSNFNWASAGGSAQFTVSFITGGSFHATNNPDGTSVTLRNVYVNSYDLDSSSSSNSGEGGNQYTSFTNVGGIELSSSTALVTSVAGVTTTIEPNVATSPGNITAVPSTISGDMYRVRVSFDEVSTFSYKVGARTGAGIAYYAIDFSEGPTFTNLASYDLILAGGAVVTSETGTNDTFTLKLSSQPSASVTVTLTGLDGTEGSLSTTSLTFTTSNWDTAQTVTVTGQSDATTDGDISYTLKATAASTDARFQGASVLIDVTNLDTVADTTPPTASIVVTDTALKVGETSLVTITFSEAVTGFTNADLTIANGTLSAVSSSDGGITWTATFTPTASVEDATNLITLDNTGVADVSGNAGTGTTNSNNYAVDTLRPTASIVVTDSALKVGETSLVTITFSEAVTGFTNADLTIANGTLSAVSSSDGGITWTATFTPTASVEDATNLITLDNTGVADVSGNAGTGTTNSNNYEIDTLRPTVAITSNKTSLAAGDTATITFTFSEAVTDFAQGDVTVSGGALSNFTGSGTSYSATFTPDVNSTTNGVLTVSNTKFTDAAGNANTDGADANNTVTMTLIPAIAVTGGTYNEASPRAVFTVDAYPDQVLSLDVQDAANTDKARTGDNEGGDDTNGDALTNASIYYSLDGGATWSLYSTQITAGSVDVLVAVDITNEIDSFFEGEEQLKLEVTSGSQTAFGYSSIMDDGTGIVTQTITAATTNVTGTNDPAVIKDDDRAITVSGLDDVSEGSNAIFTVTLPDGNTRATEISLVLSNGSGANDAEANDYSRTFTAYYFVGDTKTNLTITDGMVTLPSGVTSFFVSVPTTQDTDFEGAENFSLTATITGGNNASDTSTILDDGSGRIYDDKGLNPAGPGNDDRDLAVTGGSYNEASPRAVFTVSAEVGQVLSLDVQDAANTGKEPTGANEGGDSLNGDALTNAPIYYSLDGGASWALYSGPITAGAVDVLVAVDITNETDTVFEGEEQLKLLVNAGQVTESSAYASIKDDGTGAITASITDASTNITSPANDLGGTKDDDRPTFSVSPVKVSEGGKAFFTVTRTGDSAVSQTVQVSTSLANGDTAETNDFEAVSNQTLTFAAGVNTQTFFVQTAADAVYEGDETFTVTLANATTGALISTTAGSAKGTIADDGTGTMFNDDGSVNTNAAKDNDKPQAVNDTLAVELGSTATANIITRNDTPAASSQLQVRSIAFVDAFGVERSFNLNALQNSTRTDYDKQVQLADGKLYISANGDTLYQHEGRRFLVTAIENRGVLEHNATGLADGWTTVALNNSVVVSLQDIADGRLRFTATQALTDPEATVAQIVEMDWRSDGFTYTMSDSGGLTPSSANVIYTVTGDETIYLAPVAPGADADVDGIASRVESVLANKARGIEGIQPKTYVLDMNNLVASSAPGQSSIGIGVAFDGDLNIDSPTVGDAYQNSVTTFSWINNTYFAASNLNPDLGNFQSIVTLVAENQSTTSGVPHPDVQLRGVTVLPLSAEQESGLRALVKFTPNWSPMGFSAEIRSDATGVNNIDTDPNREGNQWRFTVDISRTGETTETFMGFVKWIDQATINAYAVAGLPLTTLDGQPITREGWVDFTQRVPGGDGVTITNADGNILLLQYTITDNAFGDNDLRTGYINDPGMPVFLQREILVADSAEVDEGGVASFAVSLNAIRLLPTTIDLSLQDVSTNSANGVPLDYAAQMEAYYIDASGNRQTLEVVNGRVQLPGGVASFNVLVRSTQDAEFETNETFTLTASLAEGTTDSGSATIVDNDAPAELPVNPPAPPVLPQAPPAPPAPVEPPPPAPEPPPVATPEVPPPVIESPAPVLPPPTTPPAPAAPVAPPAPAPANSPAPVVPTPPPVPVAPQSFSSTLAPLAPALVPADAPAPLGEAVTSSSGVPIPVSETAPPGLSIYQGITNQFIQSTDTTSKISLPFDAFIHSNKDAVIKLEAKQADDSPLPNWVRFDPATGVFEVTPPKDFKGKLDLKVLARDDDGREAVAIFQMFIGEQTTDRPQSRDSFTDKLRMVGNRPITLVRVVDASRPVAAPAPVREAPAIKAVPA